MSCTLHRVPKGVQYILDTVKKYLIDSLSVLSEVERDIAAARKLVRRCIRELAAKSPREDNWVRGAPSYYPKHAGTGSALTLAFNSLAA